MPGSFLTSRGGSLLEGAEDRAYIPGLLHEFPGISRSEISKIRRRDRRAQGLTEEDEVRARKDIGRAKQKRGRFIVPTEGIPNAAHLDFLWTSGGSKSEEIEAPEDALICSSSQWQYSGPRARHLAAHAWPEQYWSGGSSASGYFCIVKPSPASLSAILQLLDW